MHPLRKHILHKLILNDQLPFSKLKPQDIEGNLFMYHLKQLITEELIGKNKNGQYELTLNGKNFTDKLSLQSLLPRIQPNIVTLIICKNNKGQFLLYKRKKQPFLGLIGFPYGKIHLNESVLEAAKRELKEKTNLSADLSHKGDVYLTVFEDRGLLTQIFCHVFLAKNPIGELISQSEVGEFYWSSIKDLDLAKTMPGFIDIYKLTNKNLDNFFFSEFTYNLN